MTVKAVHYSSIEPLVRDPKQVFAGVLRGHCRAEDLPLGFRGKRVDDCDDDGDVVGAA